MFQVNLVFPILFIVVTVFLIIMPLFNSPFEWLMGVIVTLTGIPVYIVGVAWKRKPKVFTNFVSK